MSINCSLGFFDGSQHQNTFSMFISGLGPIIQTVAFKLFSMSNLKFHRYLLHSKTSRLYFVWIFGTEIVISVFTLTIVKNWSPTLESGFNMGLTDQ